jgi:hypothetical protein
MADQTIRLAHAALVPGRSVIDVTRGIGGVVAIKQETCLGSLDSDSLCFFTEIEIASAIVFAKTSSRMASPAILDEEERGLINVRWGFIYFPSQLARISRSESVLAKHSGGEIPRSRRIEQIADDNIPLAICSALLEVIPIRNAEVIMAVPTGLFGTIGDLTLDGERYSVEPSKDDLGMLTSLRKKRARKEKDEENAKNEQRDDPSRFFSQPRSLRCVEPSLIL